jgi:hypothetical protein
MAFFAVLMLFFCSCKKPKKHSIQEFDIEAYIRQEIEALEKETYRLTVNNWAVYFGNDSLTKIALSDFVSVKRLFFYFSQNTCPPCIDGAVDIIKKVFPGYENNEQIVLMSPDLPKRFRENYYDKRLLTLQNDFFGLELEKKDIPFFLILNSDLEIESIHLVNKMLFSRTEKYLREVKQFYGFTAF